MSSFQSAFDDMRVEWYKTIVQGGCPSLPPRSRAVFCVLVAHMEEKKQFDVSVPVAEIARCASVSRSTVQVALRDLEQAGLIESNRLELAAGMHPKGTPPEAARYRLYDPRCPKTQKP